MNWERINSPQSPTFLVTATDLQCGDLRLFINHDLQGRPIDRLTLDHIMASSSIPVVYPWTQLDEHLYWDGAVISWFRRCRINRFIDCACVKVV